MKKAYLDSSVIIRQILDEKNKYGSLGEIRHFYTSDLTRIEASRTLDRLRIVHTWPDNEVAYRVQLLHALFDSVEFIPLQPAILKRAAESFPVVVKTLDAIHIASALLADNRQNPLYFITHDSRQGRAALSVGLLSEGFE
ncbi:MAG: type II toxin-antitoxin system VapC family toxin [Deltaproteobacteria bacterium]|nr:type II toxin-antitoxin system VapC family toxin [Deltaproteobacteria bacterium]